MQRDNVWFEPDEHLSQYVRKQIRCVVDYLLIFLCQKGGPTSRNGLWECVPTQNPCLLHSMKTTLMN